MQLPDDESLLNEEESFSQTGPNELNEEDLGLDEHTETQSDSIADNEKDVMEDPVNDLDDDEVGRLFPGDASALDDDEE